MSPQSENGMVHLRSSHSVKQTLAQLKDQVHAHGIAIAAEIDHSGAAAKVGLTMPHTELLIFGDPKSGTPLMLASPTIALDLPLKALVWEDSEGQTWLSYNSPAYLKQRHGVPDELLAKIAGIQRIAEAAVQ